MRLVSASHSPHRSLSQALLVTLCWGVAATFVAAVHRAMDSDAPRVASSAAIGGITLIAFCYIHFMSSDRSVTHALGVGIAWLVLSIVAELVAAATLHRRSYLVLGSPAHPLLRNLLLFVWVFSPALFARQSSRTSAPGDRLPQE
jgi:hypothetical protein